MVTPPLCLIPGGEQLHPKGLSLTEKPLPTFLIAKKENFETRNSTLRAINIKQLKPSLRNDSVFHIFERLNTGGTQLKPQEIRNAVYRGNIVAELTKLNDAPGWRQILGIARADKNQKDVELILRLFSLFSNWSHYEKPMLRYLNRSMDHEREYKSDRAILFSKRFPKVVKIVNESLSKPFRPRGVINSAVLEAVMVTLLENADIKQSEISDRYHKLLNSKKFQETIGVGTTDTLILKTRLNLAREIFTSVKR